MLIKAFDNKTETKVQIPEEIDNKKVTVIGKYSFCYKNTIKEVIIPEGIVCIENEAFSGCDSIISIKLPDGLKSIGNRAFFNCKSLATVELPESLINIDSEAFAQCESLCSIDLPENLETLGEKAFSETGLTHITIPRTVTNVGERMLYKCRSLSSIDVETGNSTFESAEGVLFNKQNNSLVCYPCAYPFTIYTIPEWVKTIEDYAFSGSVLLKTIEVPEGVISIGTFAFADCEALTDVHLPNTLVNIPTGAFLSCKSLINTLLPEKLEKIGSAAFMECDSLKSISIPETVTLIGDTAFALCRSLNMVSIPNGITRIENNVFYGCSSLQQVILPESVTRIGYGSFSGSGIISITLPKTLEIIGSKAFMGCSALSEIVVPESVRMIEEDAFEGCSDNMNITVSSESYAEKFCKRNRIKYSYTMNEEELSMEEYLDHSDGRYKYVSAKNFVVIMPPEFISVTHDAGPADDFYRNGYGDYSTTHQYLIDNNLFVYGIAKDLSCEITMYISDYYDYDFNTADDSLLSLYTSQLEDNLPWRKESVKGDIYQGTNDKAIRFHYALPQLFSRDQYIVDYYATYNDNLILLRLLSYQNEITESQEIMMQDMFNSIKWQGGKKESNTYIDYDTGISYKIPGIWEHEENTDNETQLTTRYRIGKNNAWISFEREDLWENYAKNNHETIELFNIDRSTYNMMIDSSSLIAEELGCKEYEINNKSIAGITYRFKQTLYSKDNDQEICYFYLHNAYMYKFKLSGEDWNNHIGELERFLMTVEYSD